MRKGALFFCDAVQGFGRVPLPLDSCDLVALSAHKVHGPKGIGALWVRDGVALEPFLHGGGQEGGRALRARCRRRSAPASARRARPCSDGRRTHVERPVGDRARADGAAGRSTAPPSSAITAISTCAATASTPPG